MYILIVGYGHVGYHLSRTLLAIGHEVLVIEKDQDRCEQIRQELGSIALHGDATDVSVLKSAGVNRADVLVATVSDEDNLAACQIAKGGLGNPKTISLVHEPENAPLFRTLGVDVVVNGTQHILATIEEELPGQTLQHLMSLRSVELRMVSITLPEDAVAVGRALDDLELPPNSYIVLLVKDDGPYLPSGSLILGADDEVIAVTTISEEPMLHDTLTSLA